MRQVLWLRIGAAMMIAVLAFSCVPVRTLAAGCTVTISPSTVMVGSMTNFTVSVSNGTGAAIRWIDISVPSTAYTYGGSSFGNDWSTLDHGDGTTASGGTIRIGQTTDFYVTAISGIQYASPQDWSVRVSDAVDGSGAVACTGSLATAINGHMPQDSVNGVSDVTVTNITSQSATISWLTDAAASGIVYYGLTSDYGASAGYSAALSTEHSAQLSGLQAGVTYHFQVAGIDEGGNNTYSIDNTFMTAGTTPGGGQTGGAPAGGNQGGNAANGTSSGSAAGPVATSVVASGAYARAGDVQAPSVSFAAPFAAAYKQAPNITGTATDNNAIAAVEYSTDNGKNWLPVDVLDGLGKSQARYGFTPLLAIDGDYIVLVRAFDGNGNTAFTSPQKVVIDQLPPSVGGIVTSLGAQSMRPNAAGAVNVLVGVDQRITLSTIGGATSVVVDATLRNTKAVTQSFSLTQMTDTGLWTGALHMQHAGSYDLSVRAVDGAGNSTSRALHAVVAEEPAVISDTKTGQPLDATITVYYRDQDTQAWVLWDASSYGQTNPMRTSAAGAYSMYLPAGTYYLKASAKRHITRITNSFTMNEPTIISAPFALTKKPHVGKIAMPWMSIRQVPVSVVSSRVAPLRHAPAIGVAIPDFSLEQTASTAPLLPTQLFGRPTILTFVSSWAPQAQEQLSILAGIDRKIYNVVPVASGESKAKITAYASIAGYDAVVAVDRYNDLAAQLGAANLPTTYFVDRHGIVQDVVSGLLSKEELLQYAVRL